MYVYIYIYVYSFVLTTNRLSVHDCFDNYGNSLDLQVTGLSKLKRAPCMGPWTVLLHRQNTTDFQRTYADYREGFGTITGDYWIGLHTIYYLSRTRYYTLRVDIWDSDNAFR